MPQALPLLAYGIATAVGATLSTVLIRKRSVIWPLRDTELELFSELESGGLELKASAVLEMVADPSTTALMTQGSSVGAQMSSADDAVIAA